MKNISKILLLVSILVSSNVFAIDPVSANINTWKRLDKIAQQLQATADDIKKDSEQANKISEVKLSFEKQNNAISEAHKEFCEDMEEYTRSDVINKTQKESEDTIKLLVNMMLNTSEGHQ